MDKKSEMRKVKIALNVMRISACSILPMAMLGFISSIYIAVKVFGGKV